MLLLDNAKPLLAVTLSALMMLPPTAMAASHREAPLTALDHLADITDVFAFMSYDKPGYVTLIMNTNGFLESFQRTQLLPVRSGHNLYNQHRL